MRAEPAVRAEPDVPAEPAAPVEPADPAEPAVPVLTFAVRGPIRPADLPGLTARVCALFQACSTALPGALAACDVAGAVPDAATVAALARLRLLAGRHGCRVLLRNAAPELLELVAFLGLGDVLTAG